MKNTLIIISSLVLLISCNSGNEQSNGENTSNYLDAVKQMKPPADHKVTAIEVIDVDSYTYLRVEEEGKKFWMAITSRPIETGNQYYYKGGMMMYGFTSKQLDRTFDSIMFIKDFADHAFAANGDNTKDYKQEKSASVQNNISIDVPKDGISLAELYKNKDQYNGKSVIVKGVVVKLNEMIMGKNWIHLQDGTNYQDFNDLTITTEEAIVFSLDDTITFHGTITLNKDFGAGYKYEIIMEEGQLVK